VHRCLGSNLARLELRVALEEFLRRIPDYEVTVPDDELEWAVGVDRSLRRLPIAF
jgi:cytochrome P450